MKKLLTLLSAAVGATAAFGATPLAVWDGDFGTSAKTGTDGKTYTLVLPSGSESWVQADGTLKIGSGTQGAYINLQDGETYNLAQGTKISVLMEYTNAVAQTGAAPIYLQADAYFGLKTKDSSLDVVGDYWGVTYPTTGDVVTTMPSDGCILMVYPQGGGAVQVYSATTRTGLSDASAGGDITGLAFSNKYLQKIGIGGTFTDGSAKNLKNFENLVIKKVAVFTSAITATDAAAYYFPSEIQTINVDSATTVSAINAQFDSANYKAAKVTVASGVAITVDAAFNEKIQSVSSTGSITLSAASQPDASYNLANVDFSGVQGGLLRSWLTPGVVGFNFRSANGTDVSGALATADNWIHDNNSASGTSTAMFADGLSTLKWSSANTWSCSGSTIISGYLDDGANGGNGATVTLSNVPYETYDVIVYCSSDSNPGQFLAKTVNGTTYTWDSAAGAVVAGNAAWGKAALSTPVYGVNALRIKDLSGPLTIYGTARNGSVRGGIAAIEIMPPETPDNIRTYTLTLSGTATTWSGGNWTLNDQAVDAPASGYVEIVASASTTLTVDQSVSLADLKIRGGENIVVNVATNDTGSLYAIKATVESGVFQQGSPAVLGATPSIVVASGATFDLNGMAVNEANALTIAGAGAGNWPWALTSSGGEFPTGTLRGFTLTGDATIGGANKIGCGKSGAASYLGFGTYTLTKIGGGELSFTNIRSATGSTGTFDIADGSVTLNEYTNLDGSNADGDPWAKTEVIVREGASLVSNIGRWVWVGSLVLDGGAATTASSYIAMQDGFAGAGTLERVVFKGGASASLTGDLAVTSEMVLNGNMSFVKDQTAASDVVVTPASLTASSGTITVGSGVTFNVGTSRPTATITVAQGGTLAAQLQSASDVIALSTSAQPANVILYDANGDVVSNARISYSDGTLTIMPPVPTLPASGTVAFDTAANWVDSLMPGNDGVAIIELSDDATITVSGTYTLGSLTITGSGVVTFSGNGTITAANISVKNGATFTRSVNISATTGISLDAGTVLRLDGVTENAAISGAGAVETYGTVVFSHANTMTGGITVKPGSALSTTAAGGYGEYQSGWAYTAQRQVVVEDGGTVDINNVANRDGAVALTIAGNGILSGGVYSGAVTYSGTTAITSGSRQISSLVLTGDALVDVGAGWGLVHSGWNDARLGLNGHTLTVRGTGTFPVVYANNVSGADTTGTLVLDGATLELSKRSSNLTNINVIAKGCAAINIETGPWAIGSLTLKPTATGTTASNWNLPSGFVPKVDTSNINQTGLSDGQVLTLFTAPSGTTLSSETISVSAGGRFTTAISGNTVTATFSAAMPAPFMHYDFNAANSIAADSLYNFGNLNPTFVHARNGMGGVFDSSYKPYYGSNNSGKSPFFAGEMTVTTLLKVQETNNTILWNFGSGWGDGMALIAKDSSTISVVSWTGGAAGSDVVSVTGINNLVGKWHLVTLVAGINGTTLYVDGQSATATAVIPATISGLGQFGSIHGTAKNYSAVSGAGFILDDWRVYDAALTADDIKTLRKQFLPKPMVIRLR